MRVDAVLDLELRKRARQVGDVNAGRSLGCSDHKMVEFRILMEGTMQKARPQPWASGEHFSLLRDLLERILWQVVRESLLIFRDHIYQAQERSILMCRKSSKGGQMPAWMRKTPDKTQT